MHRLIVVAFLMTVAGCKNDGAPPPSSRKPPGENAATANAPVDVTAAQEDSPLIYPEKTAVQRLLVRAAELESNGKFDDALAVAKEAVAIDPSSPRANDMKARLEELLRRA